MNTTLNKIRSHRPCEDGWKKLLSYLGKTKADDEPLPLLTILESNGLDDALWSLRAVEGHDAAIRKLACDYALQVAHLWDMPDVVRTYLETQDEFMRDAAMDAAMDAARAAARVAAEAAAGDAAWAAAGDAARAAAWDAALAAMDAAARDAAARDAARDAAWDARAAAWAAAGDAAGDAGDAAWDAAWEEQIRLFVAMCEETAE